jgi:hypothetical protein
MARDPGSSLGRLLYRPNTTHHPQINTYYEYKTYAFSFSHNSIL